MAHRRSSQQVLALAMAVVWGALASGCATAGTCRLGEPTTTCCIKNFPLSPRMYRLEERGDIAGARRQMRDVLAVESVPHYRDIAEGQLERLLRRGT